MNTTHRKKTRENDKNEIKEQQPIDTQKKTHTHEENTTKSITDQL